MPTYEFRCPDGTIIERSFKISEVPAEIPAPDGSGMAVRVISGGAGLLFKGSGFYITDYGKDGKKDVREKAAKAADSSKGSGDAAKGGDSAKSSAASSTSSPAGGSSASSGSTASGGSSTSGSSSSGGSSGASGSKPSSGGSSSTGGTT